MTRIHQMLPNYMIGDAIGHYTAQAQKLLRGWGYESDVFADVVHEKLEARHYRDFLVEGRGAWLIYHYSTGSPVNRFALENAGNIILVYHNITPAEFFEGFDDEAERSCREGREVLRLYRGRVRLAIADSQYNADELSSLGIGPVAVAPPLFDYGQMGVTGENPFGDDRTTILFVGRVMPNKGIDDLLRIFHVYRTRVNTRSRLAIVGGYNPDGKYFRYLQALIAGMETPDVVFCGFAPNAAMGDYFAHASAFLCMSRHEGFCIPLLEAMGFGLPVVALANTAVTGTMGAAGVLVDTNDPAAIAELLDIVLTDDGLRERLVRGQRKRLADFDRDRTAELFKQAIERALDGAAP